MNDATSEKQQGFEQRVMSQDPNKAFNLDSANAGGSRRYQTGEAPTGEFQFVDKVRTKDYAAGKYETKAWQGDHVYETKAADTKESQYANKAAKSKTYETKDSRYAGKTAEVRALPDGERAFLNKGRRQADFDTHGPASSVPTQSWEGNLQKMTVEDVRKLLNKN